MIQPIRKFIIYKSTSMTEQRELLPLCDQIQEVMKKQEAEIKQLNNKILLLNEIIGEVTNNIQIVPHYPQLLVANSSMPPRKN